MVRGGNVQAIPRMSNNECITQISINKFIQNDTILENEGVISSTNAEDVIYEVQALNSKLISDVRSQIDIQMKSLMDKENQEKFESVEVSTPKSKNKMKIVSAPSTPHRIEFCPEEEAQEVANVKVEVEAQIVNFEAPQPKKAKRVQKPKQTKAIANHKLTEYFPVRRSSRMQSKIEMEEKQKQLIDDIRQGTEEFLKVCHFEGKGRGVIANKTFEKGEFVVEYAGDLIDTAEAKCREKLYSKDLSAGCYMYYFKHKGQQFCIDATAESGKVGRLVNHSRNGNLVTKTIDVDNQPRLILVAKEKIEKGEELTYDYGDRSKESLKHHPWLAF